MLRPVATSSIPPYAIHFGALLGGMLLLAAVSWLSFALADDVGDALIRNTVRLALAWYAAALMQMPSLRAGDWAAKTGPGKLCRWCWTWGLLCLLVHLMMAFHYYHHWSHADAFERTRWESGFGEGIYVSYLFALVWAADVLCWWIAPGAFAARSVWIDRLLHALMLFVVFNATVVYESGPIRRAALVFFVLLAPVWLKSRTSLLAGPA